MSIQLTSQQQEALHTICGAAHEDNSVCILQGYAGTGKTTMIKEVIKALQFDMDILLMAPTGRAARILTKKTGCKANTIHRSIYRFNSLMDDGTEEDKGNFAFRFGLRQLGELKRRLLIIVDEASMIGNINNNEQELIFGTGCLLSDLLQFTFGGANTTLLLVGDKAQLPPVGEKQSNALNADFFKEKGFMVHYCELTEVLRQEHNSAILNNATMLRELLQSEDRSTIMFETAPGEIELCDREDIIQKYCAINNPPQLNKSVIISYSNATSFQYNQEVRKKLFPNESKVCDGDILLNTKNIYNLFVYQDEKPSGLKIDLYNGEMIKVHAIGDHVMTLRAPVYVTENGIKAQKIIQLTFREIEFFTEDNQKIKALFIEDLLYCNSRELPNEKKKALYINFIIRFTKQAQKRNPNFKMTKAVYSSTAFSEALQEDPFLNCLHLKFGYAITCHKSQGGEWEDVFVDFTNRIGRSDDHLKWMYTATTRAVKTLYGHNLPRVTPISQLKVNAPKLVNKIPATAIQWGKIPLCPLIAIDAHPCKHARYWEVSTALEDTPYSIHHIVAHDYRDEYHIQFEEDIYRFDATHNKAGVYKMFKPHKDSLETKKIALKLGQAIRRVFPVLYTPSDEKCRVLYLHMLMLCNTLEIAITAVTECPESWYVNYALVTDADYARLMFYFNAKGEFTKVVPESLLGEKDSKLNELTRKMNKYDS